MHHANSVRLLLALPVLAWSGWFGWQAQRLHAEDQVCLLFAGPRLPCGPGPDAWHRPLILAMLPPLALVVMWLWRTLNLHHQQHGSKT